MIKPVYNAFGDNVIIQRIEVIENTVKGKVLHSNDHNLKPGTIILYQDNEWDQINLTKDKVVDVIWKAKIRCIIGQLEIENKQVDGITY